MARTVFACFSIHEQEKSNRTQNSSVHILVWGLCFLFFCFLFYVIVGKPMFMWVCGKDLQSKN